MEQVALNYQSKPQIKNNRNVWLELYRFFAITIILVWHLYSPYPLGPLGVAIFVAISGYCNVHSTKNRTFNFLIKSLLYVFWGFIIYIICFYCGLDVANPFAIFAGRIFQDPHSSWWFLWIYLPLTLFQPLLNKFVQSQSKWISFGIIVTFGVCLFSFDGVLDFEPYIWQFVTFDRLLYFFVIYTLAGWVSFHYKNSLNNKKIIKVLIFVIVMGVASVLMFFGQQIILDEWKQPAITIWNNTLIIVLAIFGLLILDCLPNIKNKVIQSIFLFLGKITLSIYLMHSFLWTVFDTFYPLGSNVGYQVGKFFSYYCAAVAVGIMMHFFVTFQEKLIHKWLKK